MTESGTSDPKAQRSRLISVILSCVIGLAGAAYLALRATHEMRNERAVRAIDAGDIADLRQAARTARDLEQMKAGWLPLLHYAILGRNSAPDPEIVAYLLSLTTDDWDRREAISMAIGHSSRMSNEHIMALLAKGVRIPQLPDEHASLYDLGSLQVHHGLTSRDVTSVLTEYIAREDAHPEVVQSLLEAGEGIQTLSRIPSVFSKSLGTIPSAPVPGDMALQEQFVTPLGMAVLAGKVEIVECLLRLGAPLRDSMEALQPLLLAATGGHREIARTLLEAGVDPRAGSSVGHTALHLAACAKIHRIELVHLLLEFDAYVDAEDRRGYTPLFYAAPDAEVAEVLIANGARVNKIVGTPEWGQTTPLLQAAESGRLTREYLRVLLDAGADIECPRDMTLLGGTPLLYVCGWTDIARSCDQIGLVRDMIGAGADVNAVCMGYRIGSAWISPLFEAARVGSPELVELLLDAGAAVKDDSFRSVPSQAIIDVASRNPQLQGTEAWRRLIQMTK